jgi:hypothetical protein
VKTLPFEEDDVSFELAYILLKSLKQAVIGLKNIFMSPDSLAVGLCSQNAPIICQEKGVLQHG